MNIFIIENFKLLLSFTLFVSELFDSLECLVKLYLQINILFIDFQQSLPNFL